MANDIPPQPLIAALSAVGELKVAAAVPAARARLNHSAVEVRAAAAGALGRIGGDQATEALISALGDVDLGVRRLAVNALGAMRAKAAVPRLVEAYGRPETRPEAVAALSRMPDPRALEVYIDGLGATNPGVRDDCRKALTAHPGRTSGRGSGTSSISGTLPAPVVLELGNDIRQRP